MNQTPSTGSGRCLEGVRVLELAEGIAGPFCGRMLAGMGAEVIKVEPPEGDEARRWGPFPPSEEGPERSAAFLYANTGKLGVTLDIDAEAGRDVFRKLAADSDVLIEDRPPGFMDGAGLGYLALSDLNPRLIVTSITPYGQTGSYRHYRSYHLNVYHSGGEGYMLPGGMSWEMFPERPPLQAGGYLGFYDAGLVAASATMLALHHALSTGEGQHVDGSMQDAQIALNRESVSSYTYLNRLETRATRAYSSGGLMPCKDGHVFVQAGETHFWKALVEFMGSPEWATDPALATMQVRRERWDGLKHYVREWALGLTQREIIEGCRARGIPAGAYNSPQQVLDSEQLDVRGFFTTIDHAAAGPLRYPTVGFQLSETPWCSGRAAPLLGEHNHEVYCGRLGLTAEDLARLHREGVL